MSGHRYALSRGGFLVHVLPPGALIAVCGDDGKRGYKRKRAFWMVLTAKYPGPIPVGRRMCEKCKEMIGGRK